MPAPSIPVTILSGYLGAGKTTLLNTILTNPDGMRIFALVNDFGEINVDAALISDVTDDVISLKNGCACCSLGDDLSRAFEQVLKLQAIDAVIIEASGVANLSRLALSAMNYPGFRLKQAITLINATAIRSLLTDKFVAQTVAEQINGADKLIVNRGVFEEKFDNIAGRQKLKQPLAPRINTVRFTKELRFELGMIPRNSNSESLEPTKTHAQTIDASLTEVQDHQLNSIFIPTVQNVSLAELEALLEDLLEPSSAPTLPTTFSPKTVASNNTLTLVRSTPLMRLKGTVSAGDQSYDVQFTPSDFKVTISKVLGTNSTQGLQCLFLTANDQLCHETDIIVSRLKAWAITQTEQ